jgi:hypothetical protein
MTPWVRLRRLRPDEVHLVLETTEVKGESFSGLFGDQYASWRLQALREVRGSRRYALGAFLAHPHDGAMSHSYVGSVILKREPDSERVELKNLVVHEPGIDEFLGLSSDHGHERELASTIRDEVRRKLLDHAEHVCQRRGFRRIEVDLPATQIKTVTFFLERQYVVRSIREAHPRRRAMYRMVKTLKGTYAGDPFDFDSAVEWVISEHYDTVELGKADSNEYSVHTTFQVTGRSRSSGQEDELDGDGPAAPDSDAVTPIHADCIVVTDSTLTEEQVARGLEEAGKSDADVHFFFSQISSDRLVKLARDRKIKFLDWPRLKAELGRTGAAFPPFTSQRAAGLILEVDEDTEHQVRSRGGPFWYVVLNGIGQNVNQDIAKVVLFCEQRFQPRQLSLGFGSPSARDFDERYVEWVVWGSCDLVEVLQLEPHRIADVIPEADRLWTDAEIEFHRDGFYVNQDPKKLVTCLQLKAVRLLEDPVPVRAFAARDVEEYVARANGLSTSYLDEESVSRFLQRFGNPTFATASPRRVMDGVARTAEAWSALLKQGEPAPRAIKALAATVLGAQSLRDPSFADLLEALLESHGAPLREPYDERDRSPFVRRHALRVLSLLVEDGTDEEVAQMIARYRARFHQVVGEHDG